MIWYLLYALAGCLFSLACLYAWKDMGDKDVSLCSVTFATGLWPMYILAAIYIKTMEKVNDRLINN